MYSCYAFHEEDSLFINLKQDHTTTNCSVLQMEHVKQKQQNFIVPPNGKFFDSVFNFLYL